MQLIYTSAARLVDPGKTGFGAVCRSVDMGESLQRALERMNTFSRGGEHDNKRVIYCYRALQIGSSQYHILSQLRDAGSDYTGRTNHIGHHIVFTETEIQNQAIPYGITPADIILQTIQQQKWYDQWLGSPKKTTASEELQLQDITAGSSSTWFEKTGMQENAYQLITGEAIAPALIIIPDDWQTTDLLHILAESTRLMPDKGWGKTFTSYWEEGESASDFSFICSSAHRSANANIQDLRRARLDLTRPLPPVIIPEEPTAELPAIHFIPPPTVPPPSSHAKHIYQTPQPVHTLTRAKKKKTTIPPYIIISTLSILLLSAGTYYFFSSSPKKEEKVSAIKQALPPQNERQVKRDIQSALSSLFSSKNSKEFQTKLTNLKNETISSLNQLVSNPDYKGELKQIKEIFDEIIYDHLSQINKEPQKINRDILKRLTQLAAFSEHKQPKRQALEIYGFWAFPSSSNVSVQTMNWSEWYELHKEYTDPNTPLKPIQALKQILKGQDMQPSEAAENKEAHQFFGGNIIPAKTAKPIIEEKPKDNAPKPVVKETQIEREKAELCSPFSAPLSTQTLAQLDQLAKKETPCKVTIIINGKPLKPEDNIRIKKQDNGFLVYAVIKETTALMPGEFKDIASISNTSIKLSNQPESTSIEIKLSFGDKDTQKLHFIALSPPATLTLTPQRQARNTQTKQDDINIKITNRNEQYPKGISLDYPLSTEIFKQDQKWIYDASTLMPKTSLSSSSNLSEAWVNGIKTIVFKTKQSQDKFAQYLVQLAPYYATCVDRPDNIPSFITKQIKKSKDKEQYMIKCRKTAFQDISNPSKDKTKAIPPSPELAELIQQLTPIQQTTMERTKEQKKQDARDAKSRNGDVTKDDMAEYIELTPQKKLTALEIIDTWLSKQLNHMSSPNLKPITLKISNISLNNNTIIYTIEETQEQ